MPFFSTQQVVVLALAALLLFWVVGAYNRLVALRNAIGLAWAKVDESQRQRAQAAEPLLAALREPLAAEQGALNALQATLAEATRAAALMSARPVVQAHAATWVSAEAALSAAASRVFALFEHDVALRSQAGVAAPAAAWREAVTRLGFARQLFNEEAVAYNEAIALFPTKLLVPMFRFGPAGRV
jgi:LemA protein